MKYQAQHTHVFGETFDGAFEVGVAFTPTQAKKIADYLNQREAIIEALMGVIRRVDLDMERVSFVESDTAADVECIARKGYQAYMTAASVPRDPS